jgi:hypothetical protein
MLAAPTVPLKSHGESNKMAEKKQKENPSLFP